jgi:hypothetical protein
LKHVRISLINATCGDFLIHGGKLTDEPNSMMSRNGESEFGEQVWMGLEIESMENLKAL